MLMRGRALSQNAELCCKLPSGPRFNGYGGSLILGCHLLEEPYLHAVPSRIAHFSVLVCYSLALIANKQSCSTRAWGELAKCAAAASQVQPRAMMLKVMCMMQAVPEEDATSHDTGAQWQAAGPQTFLFVWGAHPENKPTRHTVAGAHPSCLM
jgi:hypothetical protein